MAKSDIEARLQAKQTMTPDQGYNLVGVDSFEDPGDELYFVDHYDTREKAEKAKKDRQQQRPEEVLHIYGREGGTQKSQFVIRGEGTMSDGIDALQDLAKGGPYIGPRGGRYKDPQHKIPYDEKEGQGSKGPSFPKKSRGESEMQKAEEKAVVQHESEDDRIPEEYMLEYLVACIEQAYEAQCREKEHDSMYTGRPGSYWAQLVLLDLIREAVHNDNLRRCLREYQVDQQLVENILRDRGFMVPATDSVHESNDADSHQAMMALSDFDRDLSKGYRGFTEDPTAAPGLKLAPPPDAPQRIGPQDARDPFAALHELHRANAARAGRGVPNEEVAKATLDPRCPIHGKETQKAQNLQNLLPCTCGE